MNDYPLPAYLFLLFIPIGFIGSFMHHRSYGLLYRKLYARHLVGTEYQPDWTTNVGAGGCMGLIKKLKREVGVDQLRADEICLMKKATYAYRIGVPALFIFICAMYWFLYGRSA